MLGWELPPYNNGGLGVVCYQLCKALNDWGADIEFVLPYQADHKITFMKIMTFGQNIIKNQYQFGVYDSRYWTENELFSPKTHNIHNQYLENIEKIVKIAEFDVIHAHDWLTCRAAIRAKELTSKPLFIHIHSIESDRAAQTGGGNPIVREIENTAMILADKIIAVSEKTKQAIIDEYQIPADKIKVLHNSFAKVDIKPNSNENSYQYLSFLKQHNYKIISSIGRLTIQKGLSRLLEAFQKVLQFEPKTILLMVGSGELKTELIGQTAELGISKNVIFADFQRGKKYRDAYKIADLFIMPSVSEPFGLTPLEATGYGVPVIVSKQSGVAEIMHHFLKVDYWDINKMTDLIVGVLRNPAFSQTLVSNSKQEFDELSWGKTAQQLMGLYQHELNGVSR